MKKLVVLLALFALVPFAFAACGGDDDDEVVPDVPVEAPQPGPDAEEAVDVHATPDGSFAFEQASLETSAGEVTFDFENPAPVAHDFVIEDADGNDVARTDIITDDSDSVTVDLEAGEYTFYCSIPGHREGGMEGDLTVE